MIVAFAVIITFANEFMNHYPKEYYIHKKEYKKIIRKRNENLQKIIVGTSIEKEYQTIMQSSKEELKKYTRIKNNYLEDSSILGYDTPKAMLFTIGFPIFAFILSLLFYGFVAKSNDDKLRKKLYFKIINPFILTSAYWMVWTLLWFKIDGEYDIPNYILYPVFCIIALAIFVISKYLINYNKTIEEKLKNGIKLLIDHISLNNFKFIPEKDKKEVFIGNLKTYKKLGDTIK